MNINELILEMYKIKYRYIRSDFTLYFNDKVILCGYSIIKCNSDVINLIADMKEFVPTNLGYYGNVIKINSEDLPKYFSCQLNNFPKENIKGEFEDKDISIYLPKVIINRNYSFNIYNQNNYECEITPLISFKDGSYIFANINVV